MKFGTMEYWEKELNQTRSKLEDIQMHIDSLSEDIGELKSQRDEFETEYNDIIAEIKSLEDAEEKKFHSERMAVDKVYHAMHTPSQMKLVES
jgi:peptidoglycan hydrolase CwlO-like protein